MLFGALVPFLLLYCGYVYCRQTEPWPMHDHFYRTRSKWREATTWQHFNRDSPRVANFSVFNGEFSVGIHDYIFSFLIILWLCVCDTGVLRVLVLYTVQPHITFTCKLINNPCSCSNAACIVSFPDPMLHCGPSGPLVTLGACVRVTVAIMWVCVCVCVCLSVCLSATTLAATYLVYMSKVRHHRIPCRLLIICVVWTSLKMFCSEDMA